MSQKNEGVVLDYIGKCTAALQTNAQSMNSSALLLIILSFIMMAVASGIISVDQELSVAGLKLVAPSWIILVGGGWSVAGLYSYVVGLKIREAQLASTIRRLYREITFSDKSFTTTSREATPFDPTSVMDIPLINWENEASIPGKILYLLNGILMMVLLLLVPIAVQILIAFKLKALFGWRWWALASSTILIVVSISNGVLVVKKAGEIS